MVIVMEHAASEEQVQKVIETLVEEEYDVHRSSGVDYTVLGAVGVPRKPLDPRLIEVLPGVREVIRISEPYKLAGRTFKSEDTVVDLAGVPVGGTEVITMAGPVLGGEPGAGGRGGADRWRPPGPASCAAGPSSPGRRPTRSRATARRPSSGCGRRPTRTASRWSARSWTCARSR